MIRREAPADVSMQVSDWVRAEAVPLTHTSPDDDDDDLRPLAPLVEGARIVALGEATHGTREFFELKHRMLRYLVRSHGFRAFAIEANYAAASQVDAYIQGGEGDARRLVSSLGYWTWDTEELVALVEWMRRYTQEHSEAPLRFFGFDCQDPKGAAEQVEQYLQRVDPAYARAAWVELAPLVGSFEDLWRTTVPEQSLDRLDRLIAWFDEHRARDVTSVGYRAWADARQAAVVWRQSIEQLLSSDMSLRDRRMAKNINWIDREHGAPGIMVWAHNGHVAKDPPRLFNDRPTGETMGMHLARVHGRRLRVFGFAFGHGEFRARADEHPWRPRRQPGPVQVYAVELGPRRTLDRVFHDAGGALFVVDVDAPSMPADVRDWFVGSHFTRNIGAGYVARWGRMHQYFYPWVRIVPARAYDAVIYVDQTTASEPTVGSRS